MNQQFMLGKHIFQPDAALIWFRKAVDRPVSTLYWQYRVLKANPHLQRHPSEWNDLLLQAAEAGHVYAKRDLIIRQFKEDRSLRAKIKHLLHFHSHLLHAISLAMANRTDERLE